MRLIRAVVIAAAGIAVVLVTGLVLELTQPYGPPPPLRYTATWFPPGWSHQPRGHNTYSIMPLGTTKKYPESQDEYWAGDATLSPDGQPVLSPFLILQVVKDSGFAISFAYSASWPHISINGQRATVVTAPAGPSAPQNMTGVIFQNG